jgi:hypothetical protein
MIVRNALIKVESMNPSIEITDFVAKVSKVTTNSISTFLSFVFELC